MYDYIYGKVVDIDSNYIVVDNNSIGYLIYTSNPYSFIKDNDYKVYVYQYVREDENTLYGFKSKEEKDMFLKLINVKGLGCKMALPMLATDSIADLENAIEKENVIYLKKFPKIGDKLARQIILDLKGKLASSTKDSINHNDELVEVLQGLGYKNNDISKVLPNINRSNNIEGQVKEALRLLLK